MTPARLSAAVLLALGTVLVASPASADEWVVSETYQVPLGTCADLPVGTPAVEANVGDVGVEHGGISGVTVCVNPTVTVYADAHALPTAYTACLYGPAAYGEGAGATTEGSALGVTYTEGGQPGGTGLEPAPVGAETGSFELLNGGYGGQCP